MVRCLAEDMWWLDYCAKNRESITQFTPSEIEDAHAVAYGLDKLRAIHGECVDRLYRATYAEFDANPALVLRGRCSCGGKLFSYVDGGIQMCSNCGSGCTSEGFQGWEDTSGECSCGGDVYCCPECDNEVCSSCGRGCACRG